MTNKFIRDVKEVIRRLRNRGISFDGNRQYPAIPTIDNSVESHTNALRAIREAIETHERRNSKASLDSFVRLYELEDVLGGFEGGDTGAFGVDNVGSGAKVHKVTESVGGVPTAKLRSIISSDGTITITQLANEIDLSVAGGMAGFPDTIIADTAAELCSNRVGDTPVTLTYTPAVDTPNATEGHFALIVTYFQGDLVGGDGSTTVTGLAGWTQVVGSGSHMFVVHYKFLTVDDLNTTFTYTLDAVGIKKGCRVVYIVQNVNTEAPFYSFTSDYYLHGNRRANKTWPTMGAAVPSAAFATGQHAFTITHSRDYNAAADAWSDMGLVELGETSTWADLHVTEKSFPYLSGDIPCMQFRIVGRKANVSRDENLIPGETELSSMQDASWNTSGVLITRPNTYFTAIEATGAGVIQHHAEQTLELTAGEKVTFAVWFREESSYPNSTRKVLMYTVDPSNNERGVFLTKDGTPRNLYVSEFLDTQADRNTNWRYLAYKCDNDGNPSTDGMVLVLYLVAPTTGTYKFRFCPAYYSGGTSSSYAAASGKLYVMHAGLRKGWHSPRKIWTPNGPVSNSAVMGVIDNPGYLLNTGDQGNNPFESQQFTMVLNPSWIKYPKAQFVPYLANVDSTGQGVIVSGDTYTVPNGNTWTSDDLVNLFATPKYVHPMQGGVAGKYYWEARCDVVTNAGSTSYQMVGIVPPFSAWASDWNINSYPGIWYDPYLNGDGGLAVNDVIGVAMDFDAGQVKFYRNNVLKYTAAFDKNIPWAAFVAAPPAYMRPQGQWTVRMRGPFTYDPPTGFVEYDITGDPNFSFGTNTVNVGGGAEILIPGDPDTYRTLLSGAGISVTQEATAIRIAQNIPQLSLMGAGNLSKTADTIAAYDQSATTHKRVTPQEIVASTSIDDHGDVNTTGAVNGNSLVFNGTAWVPGSAGSPTTTLGDLIRRGASADERLPIGAAGEVLTVVSGQPAWAAPTGGGGGGLVYSPTNDGAAVRRAANQSISEDTVTAVSFDTEDRDDGNYYTSGSPTRLTVANAGWYILAGSVIWAASNTGFRRAYWRVNGTTTHGLVSVPPVSDSGSTSSQETSAVVYLNAGDYVELIAYKYVNGAPATVDITAKAAIHRLGVSSSPSNPVNDGCTVYRAANVQSIANNTSTNVTFDTEVRDDTGYANLSTDNDRLTITNAGWYVISGAVVWAPNATGRRGLWLRRNSDGAIIGGAQIWENAVTGGYDGSQQVQTVAYLDAGETVMLRCFQDSGGSLNLSLTNGTPRLSIHRLGTNQLPAGGTTGQALVKASNVNGDVTWGAAVGGGGISGVAEISQPRDKLYSFIDDFDRITTIGAPWTVTISGSATVVRIASETKRPGIVRSTLTAASPNAGYYTILGMTDNINSATERFVLDPTVTLIQRWLVRIPTLPNGTETFSAQFGLQEQNNSTRCVRATVSWNGSACVWGLTTATASVSTSVAATVGPTANAWHNVEIRATTARADLYVDGVLLATSTTNIPTAGMTLYSIGVKSAGAASRSFDIDAVQVTQQFDDNLVMLRVGSNVTHVDAPPAVPDSMDDEFEGTTLASKWTWRNQGTATATLSQGCLLLTGAATNSAPITRGLQIIEQTQASGDFKYRAKCSMRATAAYNGGGFALVENGTGKVVRFGFQYDGGTKVIVEAYASVTTWTAQPYVSGLMLNANPWGPPKWHYFEIERSGSTLYFRVSETGEDNSWVTLYSVAQTTYFTTAPDRVGLYVESISTTQAILHCEWFRKIGTSYAPGKFAVNAQLQPTTVNVTPDTHPTSPNSMDDEFEGTSLDSKWSWFNQGSASLELSRGSLAITLPTEATGNWRGVQQTLPAGNWRFEARIANCNGRPANTVAAGWGLREDATGKAVRFYRAYNASAPQWAVSSWTSFTAFSSNIYSANDSATWDWAGFVYFAMEYDGTNYTFQLSHDGVKWRTIATAARATYFTTAADRIELFGFNANSTVPVYCVVDWFRRIS